MAFAASDDYHGLGAHDDEANSDHVRAGVGHLGEVQVELQPIGRHFQRLDGENNGVHGDLRINQGLPPHKRRARVQRGRNELSEGSYEDFPEVESKEE